MKVKEGTFLPQILGRQIYRKELDDIHTESETGISRGFSVELQDSRSCYKLYGAHLISELSGSETDNQRVAQAEILRRHIRADLGNNKLVIVAGDLNSDLGKPALETIRGFRDIDEKLMQSAIIFDAAPLGSYFLHGEIQDRYTATYKTRYGTHRNAQFDHILISPDFRKLWKKAEVSWHQFIPEPQTLKQDTKDLTEKALFKSHRSDHLAYSVTFRKPDNNYMGDKHCTTQ